MSVRDLLEARRAERDAILERATALLVADTRIVAAWLTGSLGRGDGDSLSDIDLRVIVEDAEIGAFVANRRGEVGQIGQPILIEEAPQNAPPGGAYLLVLYGGGTGAHQVDWYWQPQVSARFPPDARMLFDRAGIPSRAPSAPLTDVERTALLANKAAFQWAMLPIAAKKIARRHCRAALTMIAIIERTLAEMQWLSGLRDAPPDYKDERTDTPPVEPVAQLALLRTLADMTQALRPFLIIHGINPPDEAVIQVYRFFDLVGAILDAGVAPP